MNLKKIKSTNPGLYIEVDLGFVCNYKCSYCPPSLNSGNKWIDYNSLINFFRKVKPKTVLLVGGEPTLYPQINILLKEMHKLNTTIHMTSNGSKSISWWKEHLKYIDVLTLSYHFEYSNIDKFIKTLEFISDNKIVTVNVSMIVDKFNECLESSKKISKIKNVYISLKALNDINTGLLYRYNNEQLQIMSELIKPKIITANENTFNIHFYGVYDNNSERKLRAQTVISNKENSYKGWLCWKGIDIIKVTADGNLFKSICDLGRPPFGNIYDKNIILPKNPVECIKEYCYCLTDLKSINKEKR